MLLFEILFTLFVILTLLAFNLKHGNIAKALLTLSGINLVLHIINEGIRWQLILIYLLFFYLLYKVLKNSAQTKFGLSVSLAAIFLSTTLALFLPVVEHNKNTGQFEVGTYTFEVYDSLRKRTLPTKVWLPIETSAGLEKAPWLQTHTITGPEIASRAGMPNFIFKHLANAKPTFFSNPANAIANNKPIILLSHGRGAVKEFNAFMAQEFASHGYLVIAPDHTKGSLVSVHNNGTIVQFDPKQFGENEGLSPDSKQDRVQKLGLRWSEDLVVTLKEFQKQFPNYKNRNIIVGGHSTGGGSTIQYCGNTSKCLGVIALDPWFEPVSDLILKTGIDKPLLSMFSDPYEKDFEPINHERYLNISKAMTKKNIFAKEIVIAKSGHIDFCDAALLSPYSYIFGQDKGKISTRRVMKIINQHALDFANALAENKALKSVQWTTFPEEMNWVDVQ